MIKMYQRSRSSIRFSMLGLATFLFLLVLGTIYNSFIGSMVSGRVRGYSLVLHERHIDPSPSGSSAFRSSSADPCVLPVGSLVSALEHLSLRRSFSWPWLSGEGVEIGALQQPFALPPGAHARYVDSKTIEQLRAAYPELANVELVSPDIVDRVETLASIGDGSFDFCIASHVIEHAESPILALSNMLRVVRKGGVVVLVAPMKCDTFDRHRNLTSFSHMLTEFSHPEAVVANHHQHFREFVWSRQLAELSADVKERSLASGATSQKGEALGIAAAAAAAASNTVTVDEERAKALDLAAYAIHFHTFDQASFLDFLAQLGDVKGVPRFEIREYVAHKYETLVVLQKN